MDFEVLANRRDILEGLLLSITYNPADFGVGHAKTFKDILDRGPAG